MKKFNNISMTNNKKVHKFGAIRQTGSLRDIKIMMDMEKINEQPTEEIPKVEEVKEEIIEELKPVDAAIQELLTISEQVINNDQIMTFDQIHPSNVRQDIIIQKDESTLVKSCVIGNPESVPVQKTKPKMKLADAIRIMVLKQKYGLD
jgi:hypothetical protein